ncbi:MAG: Rne/Rng family ribonuclease [Candidatus Bipolaricaulota bacterium]
MRKRVALTEEGRLVEVYFDLPGKRVVTGSIYKGRVETVLPGMGAAFVDVGEGQALFLSQNEISPALQAHRGGRRGGRSPIQKVLRAGDNVIIQVRREAMGKKNPQGTTKVSLPGRYWVFLPNEDRTAVSRRVGDSKEVRRLRQVANELKGKGEGLIARTAARGASREDLERDFRFLVGTWKGIEQEAETVEGPRLVYEGMDVVRSLIRDRFTQEVNTVLVDDEREYREIVEFMRYLHLEQLKEKVSLYKGPMSLFVRYEVERQLREALQRKVPLKGGGFLSIDETEALTAIDVNTGSNVRHRNQEAAIINTNLEASREIPRLLRLRRISGIIVVDYVDMASPGNEQKVVDTLQEELAKDRVPADFIDITQLGLVEITRRRQGESLAVTMDSMEED